MEDFHDHAIMENNLMYSRFGENNNLREIIKPKDLNWTEKDTEPAFICYHIKYSQNITVRIVCLMGSASLMQKMWRRRRRAG